MFKKILIIMVISTCASFAFAQESTTPEKKSEAITQPKQSEPVFVNQINRNLLDDVSISTGASLGGFKPDGDIDTSGFNGYSIQLGKEFHLGSMVSTTTEVGMNFYSFGDDAELGLEDVIGLEASAKDYGIAQRISILREKDGTVFKPYFGFGLYTGSQSYNGNLNFGGIDSKVDLEVDYLRMSYFLGVEAELVNGIVPYFRFERSDIQGDDRFTLEANSPGLSTVATDSIEKVRLSANTFSLGIGYQF